MNSMHVDDRASPIFPLRLWSVQRGMFPAPFHQREDRISTLPDPILHHILSFLPSTKLAVRTSILSKRWKSIWTGVPVLVFEFESPKKLFAAPLFLDFVDRVLHLHHGYNIEKFRISSNKDCPCDSSRVISWISKVTESKSHEIDLMINQMLDSPCAFPSSWFLYDKLATLRLSVKCSLNNIPASMQFSNLKSLFLCHVTFSSESLIQQLVLNVPVLEEARLEWCQWPNIKTINMFAPRLKKLTIWDHLMYDFRDVEIKFFAESLVSLVFRSRLDYGYSFHNVHSLISASVDFTVTTAYARQLNDLLGDKIDKRLNKLLSGIAHVKDLSLSNAAFQSLASPVHSDNRLMFPNLVALSLMQSPRLQCGEMMSSLNMFPHIESLTFKGNGVTQVSIDDATLVIVPQCFLSHLKSVVFWHLGKRENEIWVAKFFMKNARVLERMIVILSNASTEERRKEFESELLMLLGESSHVIEFLENKAV